MRMIPRTVICGALSTLILVFLFQAIASMWEDSPTYDEMVNPSVGYGELLTGDFGLVDDHPPLYRIFMALPLLAFKPSLPLGHDSWQKREEGMQGRYDFAHQFFYVSNSNSDRMLFWSRLPVVFLSLLLGLLVFQWAKQLYGDFAGLFAFFFYSFEPNIIAHSRLATNDLVLTLLIFATIYQFWCYQNTPSVRRLILTGVLLAVALLSKFSALMLFPMIFALAFVAPDSNIFKKGPFIFFSNRGRLLQIPSVVLLTMVFISLTAASVIILFYGAQWRFFTGGIYNAWTQYQGVRYSFLMGNYSPGGWWYYFPVVFLLKTPIPLLIYFFVALLFRSFRKKRDEYFLLVPVGVIAAAGLFSHMNIGIRHILAVFPFFIVLASSITTINFSRPRLFLGCFGGIAVWYITSTLSVFPSYLAYFNEFVGPKKGYLALVDSNLDWGQDLKRLGAFLEKKGISEIYLSYFGTADPSYYKIKFKCLPSPPPLCQGQVRQTKLPKFVAISATNLQSAYLPYKDSFEWLKKYKPIAQIGYSIFVYDIEENASAYTDLGILYLKYRMLAEALGEFKRVVELAPGQATAHANLGFTYALLSEFGKAREAYAKAVEIDPENSVAREGLRTLKNSM